MSHLTPDGRATLDKLHSLTGTEFTTMYLHVELEGYEKLLGIQDAYLSTGHDREELSFAKLVKGMVLEHIQLLKIYMLPSPVRSLARVSVLWQGIIPATRHTMAATHS